MYIDATFHGNHETPTISSENTPMKNKNRAKQVHFHM